MKMNRLLLESRAVVATCTMAVILASSIALAGNTWDGGGADDNWGTGANWSPDGSPTPGGGNDLFFAGSTRLNSFNNYTAFDDWHNITFNAGAGSFNITGNAIDLFGKIENLSSNTQTFGLGSIALNSATANEFNPVNGNLTITSANIFTNGNQLKVFGNNGFTLSFSSGTNIQQSGSVAINQNSTVIYNSAHSYTGDTFVNAGKLQFASGASASSSVIRIGDVSGTANAEVDLTVATGGQTLTNTIVSRAGSSGTKTIDSQNTSGTNTLSGTIALDAPLTFKQATGGTLSLSGSFVDVKAQAFTVDTSGTVSISEGLNSSLGAGGSLVKMGTGTLLLTNTSNNYTGTNNATLNANGTQIGGGTLAIAGDGSLGLAPAGAYNNIQFTGSSTLRSDASISLNANRDISIASGATAHFDSNGNTFTLNGVVNGTGGNVNINGAGGTVVLTGANTYTGTTTISAGTLQVGAGGASGTLGSGSVVNNSALVFNRASGAPNNFVLTNAVSGSGTLTQNGANIITIASANSYTGATTINSGRLRVTANDALGSGVAGTTVNSGGALLLDSVTYSTAEALTINGTGVSGSGALANTSGTSSYAGQVTAATNATIRASGTLTLTGGVVKNGTTLTIAGAGSVVIDGTGISGAATNSDLVVDGATLAINVASTYNGPTTVQNSGVLKLGASNVLPTSPHTVLTLDSGGQFDLNAQSDTVASLGGSGTVTSTAAGSSTLTVGGSNATGSFAGLIEDGSGTVGVTKTGTGTQTLTTASTYSGITTVDAGTLRVTANDALGSGAGGTVVNSGGTLRLNSVNYSTAEPLTINGSGPSGGGALTNIGTSSFAGQVTVATNATINPGGGVGSLTFTGGLVKNGTTLTIGGGGTVNVNTVGISGSSTNSDLVVDGTTLVLSAASTYNGPTTVQGANGVLKLGNDNVLPTAPHTAVSVITGGKLDLNGKSDTVASLSGTGTVTSSTAGSSTLTVGGSNGSGDFEGVIQDGNGLVSLQKTGSGSQTISGANTYTGNTVVINGTLQVGFASTGQTGTGDTTVQSGATIAGTGTILGNATVNGFIRPGDSLGADLGILSFGGDLTLTGTTTTYFQIGDPSSVYDQIRNASGFSVLTLAGVIDAGSAFEGGYTPVDGDLWALFDSWGSIDATGFNISTNLLLPDVSSYGLVWDKSNFTTNGQITLTSAPEPSRAMLILGAALLCVTRRRRQA